MIALSMDIDWAPDAVIAHALEIVLRYPIKLTIFATHASPLLTSINDSRIELAIHPNLQPVQLGDNEACNKKVHELLDVFPKAQGVRSHCFVNSQPLSEVFAAAGLKYESNLYLPVEPPLGPFRLWNGLVLIPVFWEDWSHFMFGRSFAFDPSFVAGAGVRVFDFHPVHVFLNSETAGRYVQAKQHYHDPKRLGEFRNNGVGTRTFIEDLCSEIAARQLRTYTLAEIAKAVG